ncbi:MAG: glutaminyl-peptide cyclotransferase [Rikenellaceae bacterium]
MNKFFSLLLATLLCFGCGGSPAKSLTTNAKPQPSVKSYSYIVKGTHPHATDSYTQGLQYIGCELWESTGLEGESRLMKVDLESGEGEVLARIADSEFGEGITILGDSIFMLTWQSCRAYIFSKTNGKTIDTKRYKGEGWGLTTDGNKLYMSNGSSEIAVRDPKSFDVERTFRVTLNGQDVNYLNELEWINGKLWSNIYTTDQIVIIDPLSGYVEGVIDLTGLLPLEDRTPQTDVLNGIAYDEANNRLFVTGKNWNKLFEIEIIER